jgi:hypothetical protein
MRFVLKILPMGVAPLASVVLALGCGAGTSGDANKSHRQRAAYEVTTSQAMATLARIDPPSGFRSVACFNHVRRAQSACWRRSSSLVLSEPVASGLIRTMGLKLARLSAYGGVHAVCTGVIQSLIYRVSREKCWADATSGIERLLIFIRSLVVDGPHGVRVSSLGASQAALGERGDRRVPGGTEVSAVVVGHLTSPAAVRSQS